MGYELGVDLGTTYTAAATHREGTTQIVELGNRSATIPSVIYLTEDDQILAGEAANRRAASNPSRVAREFKRRIGDPTPVILGGSPYSAEGLSARMLEWVITKVHEREGSAPERVAVTHPANWGPYKLDLLHQAFRMANLEQVHTLTEPEAAAIYYSHLERIDPGMTVAVFDLGGGTFDAAILRKKAKGFDILGEPEGIERLGGIDFDAAVFAFVRNAIGEPMDQLDPSDPSVVAAVARLRRDCVDAKEALSSDTEVTIPVVLPGVHTDIRLTRMEFEGMIRPSLADSIGAMERAVRSASLGMDEIDLILLVGGSSRIPLVGQMVGGELGRPVAVDAHPKHSVAQGAAWAAADSQEGNLSQVTGVLDVVDPGQAAAVAGGAAAVAAAAPSIPEAPAVPEAPAPAESAPAAPAASAPTQAAPPSVPDTPPTAPAATPDPAPTAPTEAAPAAAFGSSATPSVETPAPATPPTPPTPEPSMPEPATMPPPTAPAAQAAPSAAPVADAAPPTPAPSAFPTTPTTPDPAPSPQSSAPAAAAGAAAAATGASALNRPEPFSGRATTPPETTAAPSTTTSSGGGSEPVEAAAAFQSSGGGGSKLPLLLGIGAVAVIAVVGLLLLNGGSGDGDDLAAESATTDASATTVAGEGDDTAGDGDETADEGDATGDSDDPEGPESETTVAEETTTTEEPTTTTTEPTTTTTEPCSGLCTRILEAEVQGNGELLIEWEPMGFEPSVTNFHAHFFYDIYDAEQVGTNAAQFGVSQGNWHLTDQTPLDTTGTNVAVANAPAEATQICVVAADSGHGVSNPENATCVDLP